MLKPDKIQCIVPRRSGRAFPGNVSAWTALCSATYIEGASARGARIAYEKHAKGEVKASYERLKESPSPPPLSITSDTGWPL